MTQIQMIFQDPIASLDPRMTVKEIIAEGFRIKGINDNKFINKKVEEVLKLVGLVPEHASRYPHEFSGGQRQRIGIARAMVMDPELIIADEPISALDVSIQAQVINLLNNLKETLGLTILFIANSLALPHKCLDTTITLYLLSSSSYFSKVKSFISITSLLIYAEFFSLALIRLSYLLRELYFMRSIRI